MLFAFPPMFSQGRGGGTGDVSFSSVTPPSNTPLMVLSFPWHPWFPFFTLSPQCDGSTEGVIFFFFFAQRELDSGLKFKKNFSCQYEKFMSNPQRKKNLVRKWTEDRSARIFSLKCFSGLEPQKDTVSGQKKKKRKS